MVRTLASLVVGAFPLCATAAHAHDVVWLEKPEPLELSAAPGSLRVFYVTEAPGEPCTVIVTILPFLTPPPPLVKVTIDTTLPDVEAPVDVQLLRAPIGGDETVNIQGEWHATGQPPKRADPRMPRGRTRPTALSAAPGALRQRVGDPQLAARVPQ
jgi:hypothetical protein